MSVDVQLGGSSLTPQPSRLVPHPPTPVRTRMLNGGYTSFTPDKGWSFELQYGSEELVDADPVADILSRFSGGDVITFEYTPPGEIAALSFEVYIDESIAPPVHWGGVFERFVVWLYEAA